MSTIRDRVERTARRKKWSQETRGATGLILRKGSRAMTLHFGEDGLTITSAVINDRLVAAGRLAAVLRELDA